MDSYPQRILQFDPYLPEEMSAWARQFYILMQQRRSVRSFSDQPVPRDLIEQAILTAGTAPSRAHREPWHFVAVSDSRVKSKIRRYPYENLIRSERLVWELSLVPELTPLKIF